MRRIAVILNQSGVGKTTTACNLAHGLAKIGKVLLIDADPKNGCSSYLGFRANKSLVDVVMNRDGLEEAVEEARDGLWLLAGSRDLVEVEKAIADQGARGMLILRNALKTMENSFDYVVVDTASAWNRLTVAAVFLVDEVLIPISLEVGESLIGLYEIRKKLDKIRQYHRQMKLRYVLPTFLNMDIPKSVDMMDQIVPYFPRELCTPIRYSLRIRESTAQGESIFEFAPESTAAADYWELVRRIKADSPASDA